jgi:DNA-directed RNA polymerase
MQLEADAIEEGLIQYRRNRKYQDATDGWLAQDLVASCLKALAEAILREQLALKTSYARRLPKYAVALLSLDAEKLALLTITMLVNFITRSELEDGIAPGTTSVAYEIGQRCRLERFFDVLRGRAKDAAKELLSRNKSRNAGKRARAVAATVDDDEDWAKNYRALYLGQKLIALAVESTTFNGAPVFEFQLVRGAGDKGKKIPRRVTLTDGAAEWMAANESALASFWTPSYLPMVVKPRPWKGFFEGGYLATPLKLLKRRPTEAEQRLLDNADLTPVLSAVTAIQNTAYRINKDVEGYMRTGWNGGHLFFGLDSHTLQRLPPALGGDADPGEIRKRRKARAEAFKRNCRIKGLKRTMPLLLSLSQRLSGERRLYYPYQLDHRSRAYPVPQRIHLQAESMTRSLLQFADGKPLGERGAYWLAIHLANCYWKKNKVSFEQLRDWVTQHEREILAFAADPVREHRFWKEADKPWMFLAAALEWKGYREQGPGFLSHLPISMDGTCNGYQHLSAMGLDPIGGRATNLLPGLIPQDIYQEVADLVSHRIRLDAETSGADQDAARQLIGRIDRSAVKPATMTIPYGVTRRTIYMQLLDSEPVKSCANPKKCAQYLSRLLVECIPQVAVEAGKIMNWLRQIARLLAKTGRGMSWTTPTGFRVFHAPREPKEVRLATADWTAVIYEEDETRKIDARKLADGIVAHLVHSYDAAHMMFTINRLAPEGIQHFAMIHDSFGVHACDIDTLNRILREEFVRIYSEPVLQKFLDEQRAAHPDIDFPNLPQLGNLDIREVLSSPYFFA